MRFNKEKENTVPFAVFSQASELKLWFIFPS